jgi:predicted dehydrogenase
VLEQLVPVAEDARIRMPDHPLPIALVGAGAIVEYAHIPAYRASGLPIAGVFDVDQARAHDVADRFGIPRVYVSLEELLTDPTVGVVDIAVPPWVQPEILRQVVAAGKHALCQKPFALDPVTAAELASVVDASSVKVAVQQQMRYDEGIAAARSMVQRGWIGEVTAITFAVDIATDWSAWSWLVDSDRLEIMYHSIHYLDSIRSILGTPERVFCAAGRRPGQIAAAETRTMSVLLYPQGVRALVHANHENQGGDVSATFRIDGTEGAIRGTIGLLYDYPHGRPDTVEVFSRSLPTDGWLPYPVTKRWLPDAFAGPMADLQSWIAGGELAPTRVEENLGTLAVVDALYRSIASGEAESVDHIALVGR